MNPVAALSTYLLASLVFGAPLVLSCTADAADVFLKWSDNTIIGSSTVPGYVGDVPLESYSQNVSNPIDITSAGGGAGSGKVKCGVVTIQKKIDQTSPRFFQKVVSGQVTAGPVIIYYLNTSGNGASLNRPFLVYEVDLNTVFVTSLSQVEVPGDIQETITLLAGSYTLKYYPSTGSPIQSSYNCVTNTAG